MECVLRLLNLVWRLFVFLCKHAPKIAFSKGSCQMSNLRFQRRQSDCRVNDGHGIIVIQSITKRVINNSLASRSLTRDEGLLSSAASRPGAASRTATHALGNDLSVMIDERAYKRRYCSAALACMLSSTRGTAVPNFIHSRFRHGLPRSQNLIHDLVLGAPQPDKCSTNAFQIRLP